MKKQKTYKELKAIWYKKLEKSGFEDIESDEDHLKSWTADRVKKHIHTWREREQYYYMATEFLDTYKFETPLEKTIWEYHANGISVRDIVILLSKVRIKTNRDAVWLTIRRLVNRMKLGV